MFQTIVLYGQKISALAVMKDIIEWIKYIITKWKHLPIFNSTYLG